MAFIEIHGPVFGGIFKGCMHCYTMQTHGFFSPPQPHSDECPFHQFIFDDPVMVDGVLDIYFYGKKIKSTKNIMSGNVNSMESNNKKETSVVINVKLNDKKIKMIVQKIKSVVKII